MTEMWYYGSPDEIKGGFLDSKSKPGKSTEAAEKKLQIASFNLLF